MEMKYDGHSRKSGVYKITNKVNGKVYIGSAKEFKRRVRGHLSSLKNNKHQNKHLQASFNKHGTEEFLFEVLEVVKGDKLARTTREQIYLDQQMENDWKLCFNIKKKTITTNETCWSKTPEETKRKISASIKKIWKDEAFREKISKSSSIGAKKRWGKMSKKTKNKKLEHMRSFVTQETFNKISKTNKNVFNTNKHKSLVSINSKKMWKNKTVKERKSIIDALGKGRTKETYQKIADKRRRYKHSLETRKKMSAMKKGKTSPMKGKKHTKETRQKMSDKKINIFRQKS